MPTGRGFVEKIIYLRLIAAMGTRSQPGTYLVYQLLSPE